MHFVEYAAVGLFAGFFGAMVGLGGGVFMVPLLSLVLKVPLHEAIAASVVSVIATSTTAAMSYVRTGLANVRVGLTLETFTAAGAVVGGLTAVSLSRDVLSAIFGVVLLAVSGYMLYRERMRRGQVEMPVVTEDDAGGIPGEFYDPYLGRVVAYRTRRLPAGLVASFLAGNLSGLLGIGGGPIKMPTMTIVLGMPMKAAAATSNYMIGITAAASAYIYYSHGYVDPLMTATVALSVTVGSFIGARLAPRFSTNALVTIFSVIVLWLSVQMILSALGINIL